MKPSCIESSRGIRSRLRAVLLLALTGLLASVPARAATWPAVTLPQLCAMSGDVVRVRVLSSQAAEEPGGWIFTTHEVEVLDSARSGGSAPRTLRIQQLGGRTGDRHQVVGGIDLLVVGDEYLLFIATSEAGRTMPLAGPRGALRVVGGRAPDLPAIWPEAETDDPTAFLAHVRAILASQSNPQ